MNRLPVKSTNLVSVGYDDTTKILEIEFKQGWVYHYFNVPLSVYLALMSASSVGAYHAANIKEHYECERIK